MAPNRIPSILEQTYCWKHRAPVGIPCWHIHLRSKAHDLLPAICGHRARAAGFVLETNFPPARDR